jgi:hypothetical protein
LRAAHQGGSIILEVSDDGAGLNRERILAKAKEKGMPVSDGMSDAEVWQIIFAPGFSTAAVEWAWTSSRKISRASADVLTYILCMAKAVP